MNEGNIINTLAVQGRPHNPTKIPIVGALDPDPRKRSEGLGESFMKGETIRFKVGPVPKGKMHKITIGWIVAGKSPLFEGLVLPISEDPVEVEISSLKTSSMESGMYLWDVFEIDLGTEEAVMLSCGSFHLKESVGGRYTKNDPTEALPTGEDVIPKLTNQSLLTATPETGTSLSDGDTFGDIESVEGIWLWLFTAEVELSEAAVGGSVVVRIQEQGGPYVIDAITVPVGETTGNKIDLSDTPLRFEVGKIYEGVIVDSTGLDTDVTVTLRLQVAVSQG